MAARSPLLVALTALLVAGCAGATAEPTPQPRALTASTYGPDVVHQGGLRDVRFGESMDQLTRRGEVVDDAEACGPRFAGLPSASPVFADGRLVLVWAYLPLHTPEGIGVGAPLETARLAYPGMIELKAPPRTYRFDGLMAVGGDRAYLFLHDGHTVQKLIVGYREYAQRLFDEGFGTC
jgi:hypothetical protein